MFEALQLDLKLAVRSLGKRPAFALLAIATLGLGIGAVTSVFSVVNGVLLRPLAYRSPERIVILWHDLGNGAQSLPALHPKDLWDYRQRSELFEEWTLATGNELILGDDEDPELVDVGVVEANFHSFFGASPLYGRSFTPEENVHGGPSVAILSHRLWARRYGSDPAIVGNDAPSRRGRPRDRRHASGVVPAAPSSRGLSSTRRRNLDSDPDRRRGAPAAELHRLHRLRTHAARASRSKRPRKRWRPSRPSSRKRTPSTRRRICRCAPFLCTATSSSGLSPLSGS